MHVFKKAEALSIIVFALLALLTAILVAAGCNLPNGGDPEVLDSEHPGWKNPNCSACHVLPVEDHTVDTPPECVVCHGANGACVPGETDGSHTHSREDACIACHQNKHGFTAAVECVACHFASQGTGMCENSSEDPDPDNETDDDNETEIEDDVELSDDLESGCFGWPDKEFTVGNKASLTTALSKGEKAVAFSLEDTDQKEYSLAGLLQTKPVLLVFGSYT